MSITVSIINPFLTTSTTVIVTPLLVFYEGLLIILFWSLPIRKTLEDSPTRLYTTYQGTGILIVALLTYNIILRPSPFSFAGVFDKLGKQLQIPQKIGRKWVRMGDEAKAAAVIRTLYSLREKEGVAGSGLDIQEVMSSVPESPGSSKSPKRGGAYRCGDLDKPIVRMEVMNSLDEERCSDKKENQLESGHKETVL